jgi:hypothetical protein
MGVVEIPATGEPVKVLTDEQAAGDWTFALTGENILLDHSRRDIDTVGRRVTKGDRGRLDELNGVELWALNDGSQTAELDLSPARFNIEFNPRTVVGGVQTSSSDDEAPASDAFVWTRGTAVDVNASTATEAFRAPDRADFVVVSVDDADGSYHVEVAYQESVGGSDVTVRDANNSADYAGDSTTDVFVRTAIASPYVEVRIVDDSGSQNEVDYSIYAR